MTAGLLDLEAFFDRWPDARVSGQLPGEVVGIDHDHRRLSSGDVFVCIEGATYDGHRFAGAAASVGASLIVANHDLADVSPIGGECPAVAVVPDTRAVVGPLAALIYEHPSERLAVVGVTGTNGKTTTTHLLSSLLDDPPGSAISIGTLSGARTTPEGTELQSLLHSAVEEGVQRVAMEVSSHALTQHRVDGTRFAVVAFTNLSQDHLDFHGTMEHYFEAKSALFTPAFSDRAVINIDDPFGERLASWTELDVQAVSPKATPILEEGVRHLVIEWRGAPLRVGLGGRFNVANVVMALEVGSILGLTDTELRHRAADLSAPAGRFESVDAGQEFAVIVDFAHTPDGLANVLEAARQATAGRVLVVFGCGGDRDREKRPMMGGAAEAGADEIWLTSDNSRSEDSASIVSDIESGMEGTRPVHVEIDRRSAISLALAAAHSADVVVVAGKGHEQTQESGNLTVSFDDRTVVAEELRRLHSGGTGP